MLQLCVHTLLYLWAAGITDVETLSFRWTIHFWYFCLIWAYVASLALYAQIKQEYQKWIIHRKLRVPTSEREGKLSNPRGRAAHATHGENLQKFTETRARPPRARNAFISLQPRIQYSCTKFSTDLVSIALVVLTSIRIVDFCARSTISTLIKCA